MSSDETNPNLQHSEAQMLPPTSQQLKNGKSEGVRAESSKKKRRKAGTSVKIEGAVNVAGTTVKVKVEDAPKVKMKKPISDGEKRRKIKGFLSLFPEDGKFPVECSGRAELPANKSFREKLDKWGTAFCHLEAEEQSEVLENFFLNNFIFVRFDESFVRADRLNRSQAETFVRDALQRQAGSKTTSNATTTGSFGIVKSENDNQESLKDCTQQHCPTADGGVAASAAASRSKDSPLTPKLPAGRRQARKAPPQSSTTIPTVSGARRSKTLLADSLPSLDEDEEDKLVATPDLTISLDTNSVDDPSVLRRLVENYLKGHPDEIRLPVYCSGRIKLNGHKSFEEKLDKWGTAFWHLEAEVQSEVLETFFLKCFMFIREIDPHDKSIVEVRNKSAKAFVRDALPRRAPRKTAGNDITTGSFGIVKSENDDQESPKDHTQQHCPTATAASTTFSTTDGGVSRRKDPPLPPELPTGGRQARKAPPESSTTIPTITTVNGARQSKTLRADSLDEDEEDNAAALAALTIATSGTTRPSFGVSTESRPKRWKTTTRGGLSHGGGRDATDPLDMPPTRGAPNDSFAFGDETDETLAGTPGGELVSGTGQSEADNQAESTVTRDSESTSSPSGTYAADIAPATRFGALAPATSFGVPPSAMGFGAPVGGVLGLPSASSGFAMRATRASLFGGATHAAGGGTRLAQFQGTRRAIQHYRDDSHDNLQVTDDSQGNRGPAAPAPVVREFGWPAPAPRLVGAAPAPASRFDSTPELFSAPASTPAFGTAPAPVLALGAAPARGGRLLDPSDPNRDHEHEQAIAERVLKRKMPPDPPDGNDCTNKSARPDPATERPTSRGAATMSPELNRDKRPLEQSTAKHGQTRSTRPDPPTERLSSLVYKGRHGVNPFAQRHSSCHDAENSEGCEQGSAFGHGVDDDEAFLDLKPAAKLSREEEGVPSLQDPTTAPAQGFSCTQRSASSATTMELHVNCFRSAARLDNEHGNASGMDPSNAAIGAAGIANSDASVTSSAETEAVSTAEEVDIANEAQSDFGHAEVDGVQEEDDESGAVREGNGSSNGQVHLQAQASVPGQPPRPDPAPAQGRAPEQVLPGNGNENDNDFGMGIGGGDDDGDDDDCDGDSPSQDSNAFNDPSILPDEEEEGDETSGLEADVIAINHNSNAASASSTQRLAGCTLRSRSGSMQSEHGPNEAVASSTRSLRSKSKTSGNPDDVESDDRSTNMASASSTLRLAGSKSVVIPNERGPKGVASSTRNLRSKSKTSGKSDEVESDDRCSDVATTSSSRQVRTQPRRSSTSGVAQKRDIEHEKAPIVKQGRAAGNNARTRKDAGAAPRRSSGPELRRPSTSGVAHKRDSGHCKPPVAKKARGASKHASKPKDTRQVPSPSTETDWQTENFPIDFPFGHKVFPEGWAWRSIQEGKKHPKWRNVYRYWKPGAEFPTRHFKCKDEVLKWIRRQAEERMAGKR